MQIKMEEIEKMYQEKLSECNRYKAVDQHNQSLTDKLNKAEEAFVKANSSKD
jgi:hypothetical protein